MSKSTRVTKKKKKKVNKISNNDKKKISNNDKKKINNNDKKTKILENLYKPSKAKVNKINFS